MRGDCDAAERLPDEGAHIDGAGNVSAKRRIAQKPMVAIEGHVVSRQARTLAVSGSEPGIVAEGFGVRRQQVMGQGEATREKLVADLLRRDAEPEDDSFALGISLAPVDRISLELQPPSRFQPYNPQRTP